VSNPTFQPGMPQPRLLYAWDWEIEELNRLRAALKEISDLPDVRCDEAPGLARRALMRPMRQGG
jgi:hypothetical protein